uniref:glucuronosyltransferase n=1 Tax=Acrobeloides nanus TaxID=290746 RepID=A0A914DD06_9BILA
MNGRIADTLAEDGHEVVMFIPEYDSSSKINGTKLGTTIRMNNISTHYEEMMAGWEMLTVPTASVATRIEFEESVTKHCEAILKRREELEILRQYNFDIAFSEMLDFCGIGVIHYLGIKSHFWFSTTPLHDHNSYNLGVPSPISYVPLVEENPVGPRMNFWERAWNFYMYLAFLRVHWYSEKMMTDVFRRLIDPNFPSLAKISSESTLCFVNSDEFFDAARPILHQTIYIGGLGISDPKPLNEPYKTWIEKGKKGIIMFSLGSLVPTSEMKMELKKELFEAFASVTDYHFIMKIDKGDESIKEMAKSYTNVDVTEWMPQSDILAHPRVQLFITHAGLNGILESVLRGVPLITIPMFADQFRNGKVAEYRGVGYYLSKTDLNGKNLKKAIETVLNNTKYKQSAIRLSNLIKDKPFKPEEVLLKWTNFVAKYGSLPELQVEDCSCFTPNEVSLNSTDAFSTLYYLFSTFDLYPTVDYEQCRSVSCLNCTYKVHNQLSSNNDAIKVTSNINFYQCDGQLRITNCKSDVDLLGIAEKWKHRGNGYAFLTQESDLCITFTSRSAMGTCSYSYSGANACYWHLKFQYVVEGADIDHFTLQPQNPYGIYDFSNIEGHMGLSVSTVNNYSLELWSASTYNTSGFVAVYDAPNLTNYVNTLLYWNNFDGLKSQSNSFIVTIPDLDYAAGNYQFLWRIPELHAANCNDTRNFDLAYPYNTNFSKSISALNTGLCVYSVVMNQFTNWFPILHVSRVNYVGNGSVKVTSPVGLNPDPTLEYELFEFTQETAKYMSDNYIYGNLLNFNIPPGGQLELAFDSLDFVNLSIADKTFDDYGFGVIQSIAYTYAFYRQDLMQTIRCNKGLAAYKINIVSADVDKHGYLSIYADSKLVKSYTGVRVNETLTFNATQVFVVYTNGILTYNTDGFLIRYEGVFVETPESTTTELSPSSGKTQSPPVSSQGSTPTQSTTNGAASIHSALWSIGVVILYGFLRKVHLLNMVLLACLLILISCSVAEGQSPTSVATTATPNCQCYTQTSYYFNSTSSDLSLFPTSKIGNNNAYQMRKSHKTNKKHPRKVEKRSISQKDIICPCLSCAYKFHTDYYTPADAIYIDYKIFNGSCRSYVSLTNCHSNLSLLTDLQERIYGGTGGSGIFFESEFYTQENDLCLTFNSNSSNGMCDYDAYTPGCYWEINFSYIWEDDYGNENAFDTANFTLNKTLPISMIDLDYLEADVVTVTADTGTLELYSISFNHSRRYVPLCDAKNLSNYVTSLISDQELTKYQIVKSKSGSLTMQSIEGGENFMMLFRIPEIHAANCSTMDNLNYAFPVNKTFTSTISATNSGSCMFTILVPIEENYFTRLLPILHISNISYTGDSSVKAYSEFGFDSTLKYSTTNFDLFELTQESSPYFTDFIVYGSLINFIIPPNGVLTLSYNSLNPYTMALIHDLTFTERKLGVVQSINYPFVAGFEQNVVQHIGCSKGLANFKMTILYADIPPRGYLKIFGDGQVIKEYKTLCSDHNILQNETINFIATDVLVVFQVPLDSQRSRGMLLNYEGNFINQN